MNYGGSPIGPAGTGKTETVKDLGRALGIFVVVTNCSGEHRSGDMAKIFKGLCMSGLWGCFDEFNRIMSEVLSVIAMQVEAITNAKNLGIREFEFPGDSEKKIAMNPACGYFITMNPPEYGGRQKLPENLKVLFRGICMMVPSREVIIQVKLAASGYLKCNELAKKFRVLYELCEEQLSKQRHYDFGLRNILSVLRTAGDSLREDDIKLKKEAELEGREQKEPDEILIMMGTLRDMNLSKLVAQDVSLFNDLLADIFPGLKPPQGRDYAEKKDIDAKIIANSLVNHKSWFQKIIQVFETSKVRHGFMIIGPVGVGKSSILQVLTEALSVQHKHILIKLNPKSFTKQEMFGIKDFSGDWTPGVFSEIWEKSNKKENKNITWITCDGPVDAEWIENLNTVLDDNRVLTLANGGRIFMRDNVKMVFEVENLNNASPATVSRCGQIFVSDIDLGYLPVMEGWVNQRIDDKKQAVATDELGLRPTITKLFDIQTGEMVKKLMNKYFKDDWIIELVEKLTLKNPIMTLFPILKMTMTLNLLNGILGPILTGKTAIKLNESSMNRIIVFSILWGVSGVYEPGERNEIQNWMKDKGYDLPKYKENETAYDYEIAIRGDQAEWNKIEPETWKPPKKIEFSQILMPTIDATRAEKIIRYIAYQEYSTISRRSALVLGGPGTAKTSSVLMYSNKFDSAEMILHRINFSSATLPVHFQMSIDSVCEQKIQKGFGPKDMKQMTVFVDDFSMPELNKWGDQVTLEIVRQLIEDYGFYVLDKLERGNFKNIENLRYIAAMSHPGGGRNDIPNRLKRQFFIFNMTLPERIDLIFNPILKVVFKEKDFSDDVNTIVDNLSNATISLWKQVKSKLLPTPSKFHYVFNLRDVSRIFKGMCIVLPDTIKSSSTWNKNDIKPELFMIALWRHECERIFTDKLLDIKEKDTIKKFIQDTSTAHFDKWKSEIEEKLDVRQIIF